MFFCLCDYSLSGPIAHYVTAVHLFHCKATLREYNQILVVQQISILTFPHQMFRVIISNHHWLHLRKQLNKVHITDSIAPSITTFYIIIIIIII